MMSNFLADNMKMNVILVIIVVAVIIFAIVSSIMGRKAQRIEREKRKKQVKDKIKQYIKDTNNRKNLRLEYEKVITRKGKEFKYRDIFDVIVDIYEAKTNVFLEQKAFEIEGISKKINKKQYETIWIVNQEINLEETKRRIEINNKKVIKLTREEKKRLKLSQKKNMKHIVLKHLKSVKRNENCVKLDNLLLLSAQNQSQRNLSPENKMTFIFFVFIKRIWEIMKVKCNNGFRNHFKKRRF